MFGKNYESWDTFAQRGQVPPDIQDAGPTYLSDEDDGHPNVIVAEDIIVQGALARWAKASIVQVPDGLDGSLFPVQISKLVSAALREDRAIANRYASH